METIDYFVLSMIVIAYLGWIFKGGDDSESPNTLTEK